METLVAQIAAMSIGEIARYVIAILAIFGVAIDLTPWIKINPIRGVFIVIKNSVTKWITDIVDTCISGIKDDLKNQKQAIDKLSIDLQSVSDRFDMKEIGDIRRDILNFGMEIQSGRNFPQEEYDRIMEQYEKYEKLIEKHGLTNGKMDITYAFILKKYNEHLDKNDFLQEE